MGTCKIIEGLPESYNGCVGEEMVFEVELDSANIDGTWSLNGEKLESGRGIEISCKRTLHKLVIMDAKLDMSGELLFHAADAASSCKLNVGEGADKFAKRLSDVSA